MKTKVINKIALLLVSTAAMLMFLPTILPHHHHGHAICFCIHHEKHQNDNHNCTHTDTEASCTLNINYFTPKDDSSSIVLLVENEKDHTQAENTPFLQCIDECGVNFSAWHFISGNHSYGFLNSFYKFISSDSNAGRAPPYFFIA